MTRQRADEGRQYDPKKVLDKGDELIYYGNTTYAMRNGWLANFRKVTERLHEAFGQRPGYAVTVTPL